MPGKLSVSSTIIVVVLLILTIFSIQIYQNIRIRESHKRVKILKNSIDKLQYSNLIMKSDLNKKSHAIGLVASSVGYKSVSKDNIPIVKFITRERKESRLHVER